ncbi:MAG: hypothetical protein UW40_C0005G0026 [Parcubacteria group bacterium GW2011_GWF2_44_17]|nr:MAG: hypothetical protein UW40_C0005G0026 [Parcubacteria group bacterium GW2011_GWF2_44_17]
MPILKRKTIIRIWKIIALIVMAGMVATIVVLPLAQ